MFLVDTNVISELRKARMRRTDPRLAAWAATVEAEDLHLSVITIQEIELGILRAERSDRRKGEVLRSWMTQYIMPNFRDRIFPVNLKTALRAAELHMQGSRPVSDTLIAATAWAHNLTMVTRNVRDFGDTGVTVINPWNDPQPQA
jgi:predicted nucleic acid-binding protein